MLTDIAPALKGLRPMSCIIKNVNIVNVFNSSITPGCIGIMGKKIVYAGKEDPSLYADQEIDGCGSYAVPGFIDSHMHLESSFLTPAHFARIAVSCGTTTVAADPHEIGNVLGIKGIKALKEAAEGLPLRVLMMAPSTVPSAPGFEGSGFDVGPDEAAAMLDEPYIYGLGEVMDFNAVAEGGSRILRVIEEALKRGRIIDGHASLLKGKRLQAFRAAGIDSDHTVSSAAKLKEELALGFTVQVQDCMLSGGMVRTMESAPVQDRICLVTDDVPLPKLMHEGHLNAVVRHAIALGLDPLKAIRYATINPAVRLRLYDLGGIAPGMTADIQLIRDISNPLPWLVMTGGRTVFRDGGFLYDIPEKPLSPLLGGTMHLRRLGEEDFTVSIPVSPGFKGGFGNANIIHQDGSSVRTKRINRKLRLLPGHCGRALIDTEELLIMTVFNRYGIERHGTALIDGMPFVKGAAAITYGHDCHNLSVYGGNAADMAIAANAASGCGGGIALSSGGKLISLIPLPYAGLLSDEKPEDLLKKLDDFLENCRIIGFRHESLMSFFTVMPLAVSPEIKCTDQGLLDVAAKKFLPLVDGIEESM